MERETTPGAPPNAVKPASTNGKDDSSPENKQVRDMLQNLAREQLISLIVKLAADSPAAMEAVRDAAEKDPLKTKLFIRELAWETTSSRLREVFSQYGDIVEAAVVTDRRTGKSRGYGFVTFKNASSAIAALESPNKEIDGRITQANLASIGNPFKGRFTRDMREALPPVNTGGGADVRSDGAGGSRDGRDANGPRIVPDRHWRDVPLPHAISGQWNAPQENWSGHVARVPSPVPMGYPDYGLSGMHSPGGRYSDYPRGAYPAAYSPRGSVPAIQTGYAQPVGSYSPPGPTGIAYPSSGAQYQQPPGSPLPYPPYSASPTYGPTASYAPNYPPY